jgi:hypothetical protein
MCMSITEPKLEFSVFSVQLSVMGMGTRALGAGKGNDTITLT